MKTVFMKLEKTSRDICLLINRITTILKEVDENLHKFRSIRQRKRIYEYKLLIYIQNYTYILFAKTFKRQNVCRS